MNHQGPPVLSFLWLRRLWRNHPIKLGPGAPNQGCKAIMTQMLHSPAIPRVRPRLKPRYRIMHTDNTHSKVSPEITTQNISYISELQWNLIITKHVQKVVSNTESQTTQIYSSLIVCSGIDKTTTSGMMVLQ